MSPIRMDLDAQARSGVFTVRNDGREKLSFQMQGMEWTQDAAGADQYAATSDLIYFPRLMSIEPGKEGVIRVGVKSQLVASEKSYRLFIEELPGPPKPAEGSVIRIDVLVRFGAPIFIAPLKAQDSAEIASLDVSRGLVTLSVKNTGNRHHIVQGIDLKGTDAQGNEVYALTLADRYLLTGTSKTYSAAIPPAQCSKLAALNVELRTDRLGVQRKLAISRAMCS